MHEKTRQRENIAAGNNKQPKQPQRNQGCQGELKISRKLEQNENYTGTNDSNNQPTTAKKPETTVDASQIFQFRTRTTSRKKMRGR